MRVVIGLIAVMSMGALSQALATEPEPQAVTTPQPAQDSSPPAQAAPSPPDLQAGAKAPVADEKAAAAASATSAAKPVVVKSDKPELTHDEQLLVSKGYKVQVVNGEKIFCRREQQIGSRLNEVKRCGTVSQLTQQGNNQRDDLRNELKVKTPAITR
jgi:hypothetical protein